MQREGSAVNQKVIRDNFDVYFRMKNYISQDIKQAYNNYLCYVFVANIRDIVVKGSEKKTIKKLLNIDYVLRKYKLEVTKHSILTGFFIIFYKMFYKKYLINKYKL